MEPRACHLSVKDLVKGKDKLKFGWKHLRLFSIRLGYGFRIVSTVSLVIACSSNVHHTNSILDSTMIHLSVH